MTAQEYPQTVQLWHRDPGLKWGGSLTFRGDPHGPSLEVRRESGEFTPATPEERRAIRIETTAERLADREVLACQSCLVEDLLKLGNEGGDGPGLSWEDDVEGLTTDPSDWDLEQCREFLDGRGIGHPDPDPWAMDRAELLELIEAESEDDGRTDRRTDDDLRAAAVEMIDNESVDGLDDWREAVREADPPEVFEWWLVTKWLASELKQSGEVVASDGANHWWGRTTTGQQYIMDGVLQTIAARIVRD